MIQQSLEDHHLQGDGGPATGREGWAARWYGGSELRLERQSVVSPAPGQAVVRMVASGICGSDVHAVRGDFQLWPPPITLGHEGVGIVDQLGEGFTPASRGQMVSVCPSVSCGVCYQCREGEELLCTNRKAHLGAFADYCVVPLSALYPLPEGVSWRAGVFTEPLACVLHAVGLAGVRPGHWVGVVGGGTMGMLLVQVARQHGAHVLLSEPDDSRRALGATVGADVAVDPDASDVIEEAHRATGGVGLDCVIEAVGSPATVQQAMQMARRGGHVVVMGVADRTAEMVVRPYDLYERQLTVRGSFIRNFDFQRAVRMLDRLQLESLVTAEFPLREINQAIDHVAGGRGLKTVVVTSAATAAPAAPAAESAQVSQVAQASRAADDGGPVETRTGAR
jgi:L-iditol 2-dehydrogenase